MKCYKLEHTAIMFSSEMCSHNNNELYLYITFLKVAATFFSNAEVILELILLNNNEQLGIKKISVSNALFVLSLANPNPNRKGR